VKRLQRRALIERLIKALRVGLRVAGRLPISPPKQACRDLLFARAFAALSGCRRCAMLGRLLRLSKDGGFSPELLARHLRFGGQQSFRLFRSGPTEVM
jgi:hypothetical protein